MIAEIIAIGDEILIGQITDTNSSFIASRLNNQGIEVHNISAISDSRKSINEAVAKAMERSDITIITGGLGPTNDDITKKCLTEFFNTELVFDKNVFSHIKTLFKGRNIRVNKQNISQAMVPVNCNILTNTMGTAPGLWFSKDNKHVISLPGVPFEMKALIDLEVIPRLKNENKSSSIVVHKSVNVYDIPESELAEALEEWERALPKNISLAYLPSSDKVKLRLSAKGESREVLEKDIDSLFITLKGILPFKIISPDTDTIEILVNKLLIEKGKTLSIAESCTGGKIAHLITSVPGSSLCFEGSIVSYSNTIKEKVLGICKKDIENYGAVSKNIVEQMANRVRSIMNTDYSIATSGIAGPQGGTEDKPIGTIWIAIASKYRVVSEKNIFSKNRERNIERSSSKALEMLIKEINNNKDIE